jgi:hypothetical protein
MRSGSASGRSGRAWQARTPATSRRASNCGSSFRVRRRSPRRWLPAVKLDASHPGGAKLAERAMRAGKRHSDPSLPGRPFRGGQARLRFSAERSTTELQVPRTRRDSNPRPFGGSGRATLILLRVSGAGHSTDGEPIIGHLCSDTPGGDHTARRRIGVQPTCHDSVGTAGFEPALFRFLAGCLCQLGYIPKLGNATVAGNRGVEPRCSDLEPKLIPDRCPCGATEQNRTAAPSPGFTIVATGRAADPRAVALVPPEGLEPSSTAFVAPRPIPGWRQACRAGELPLFDDRAGVARGTRTRRFRFERPASWPTGRWRPGSSGRTRTCTPRLTAGCSTA